jgi:hypothetical protein
VCISANERLTASQEYILSNITEIFGGDVSHAISILATFCDGGPVLVKNALDISKSFSKVRESMERRSHIQHIFEFNNSAMF